jgi:hypothetical protein
MHRNAAFLVMRWYALVVGNRLRSLLREHKIDLAVMIPAAAVIGIYLSEALYLNVKQNAAALRAAWPLVSMAGLGAAAFFGLTAGWRAASLTLKSAFAAWTAALPIPVTMRLKSAGFAACVVGAAEAALLGAVASIVCAVIGVAHPGIDGLAIAVAFLPAFGVSLAACLRFAGRARFPGDPSRDAAALSRQRYASDSGPLPGWGSRFLGRLATLDQAVPRWAGRWAMDDRVSLRAAPAVALLLCVAFAVAVSSLVQRNAVPASILGAGVAHAVFVGALGSHPLASAVLKSSPLRFVVAWAGVVRLPLAISLACFAPLAAVSLVADPAHWLLPAGSVLALLAANGIFSVISANSPLSRNTALIVHGVVLALILKEVFEIDAWVVLPVTAFLIVMWRSARRRYRVYA